MSSGRVPEWLARKDELIESRAGRWLYALLGARLPKRLLAQIVMRLEGGEGRSRTLRRVLWERNGVDVGAYSYGALLIWTTHRRNGLRIGRFVSISQTAKWGLNHPTDRVSTSSEFYVRGEDHGAELEICHDAWIGEHVTITPGCRRIGVGAVIGANSVVTSDVPDYAIAFGAPARVKRFRFDERQIALLLASRWWELPKARLAAEGGAFTTSLPSSPEAQRALETFAAARGASIAASPSSDEAANELNELLREPAQ